MTWSPTFLICSERSGSNLIRAMVDAHRDICAPRATHLGRLLWLNIQSYGDLDSDTAWRMLLRHTVTCVSALGPIGDTTEGISEELLFERIKERNFAAVYRFIYEKFRTTAGKSHVFIKELHVTRQLHLISTYFPNAKFVFQIRDPRDYILSCKNADMHYGSVAKALKIWEEDQAGALHCLRALPGRVFPLRYEDLLAKPEAVLRAMCQFLELDFDPGMMRFYEKPEAKRSAEFSAYWTNIASPLIGDNVGKYRTGLSHSEIAFIERRVGTLMRTFGYETETTSVGLVPSLVARLHDYGLIGRRWPLSRAKKKSTKNGQRSFEEHVKSFGVVKRSLPEEAATLSSSIVFDYAARSVPAPRPEGATSDAKEVTS